MRVIEGLTADSAFDVVVIGAGGAGMAAALFASLRGARVLLVERSDHVGGTTTLSAGTIWIPGTRHAAGGGAGGDRAAAAEYLRQVVGNHSSEAMRQAFLENGPEAVAELEARSEVKLRAYPRHPDYQSALPGAALSGRALEPLPYDGRLLGARFALLREPIPEFTVLGGMMVDRTDIRHLLGMTRSWASFRHAMGLLLRHAADRVRHPRGTRLVMGNALVGRLLASLDRCDVTIALRTELADIVTGRDGGVDGVVLRSATGAYRVAVAGGLVLASGGFNLHPARRAALIGAEDAAVHAGASGSIGAAQELALAAGARLGEGGLSHAFWAPVSVRKRADGSTAVFPHFVLDRSKPGTMAVDRSGRRFVNEAIAYHPFALRMQQRHDGRTHSPAFLITDADGLRRYGLGMVRPGGRGLRPFLADGYLAEAPTLRALAARLGIDAAGLADSVARMNDYARTGVDPEFGRGATEYERHNGDSARGGPNPTLGPIARPPFYAVRLLPGDIGAATGLVTDTEARVLNRDGRPIAGLYACGNDMHSVMGGAYPGPGITLGPALTFAFVAARHATGRLHAPDAALSRLAGEAPLQGREPV
jgi:succinate dehydrogenase/fumarate reductase flavoprotein subunit